MCRLGAIHDDSAVCQKIGREEGVMSSVLLYPSNFVLGPWTWTKCSAMKIKELMEQENVENFRRLVVANQSLTREEFVKMLLCGWQKPT